MKIEQDRVEILSGIRHGQALGSPVALLIENKDWENWQEVMATEASTVAPEKSRRVKRPRPGHADSRGWIEIRRARFTKRA
jgi:chorismate synthase